MEIVEALEEVEAEVFPPRPGGLVDRHRQRKAEEKARQDQEENAGVPVEERAYRAVKVAPESPEVVSALTYTIAAGQSAMILPASPYRYRATIVAVDTATSPTAKSVILAKDSGAALGQTGFALPFGVPITVHSRAQLWAYNSGGTGSDPVQVSVLAEIYAPEGAVPGVAAPAR